MSCSELLFLSCLSVCLASLSDLAHSLNHRCSAADSALTRLTPQLSQLELEKREINGKKEEVEIKQAEMYDACKKMVRHRQMKLPVTQPADSVRGALVARSTDIVPVCLCSSLALVRIFFDAGSPGPFFVPSAVSRCA